MNAFGSQYLNQVVDGISSSLISSGHNSRTIDLQDALPGFGIWQKILDAIKGDSYYDKHFVDPSYQNAINELITRDSPSDQLLEEHYPLVNFDQMVESSIENFRKLISILTTTQDQSLFLIKNGDLSKTHLFNGLVEYLNKKKGKSESDWFSSWTSPKIKTESILSYF